MKNNTRETEKNLHEGSGPDPINKIQRRIWLYSGREAKISHVTYLIGQCQHRVKLYAWILFIGSGPGLGISTSRMMDEEIDVKVKVKLWPFICRNGWSLGWVKQMHGFQSQFEDRILILIQFQHKCFYHSPNVTSHVLTISIWMHREIN